MEKQVARNVPQLVRTWTIECPLFEATIQTENLSLASAFQNISRVWFLGCVSSKITSKHVVSKFTRTNGAAILSSGLCCNPQGSTDERKTSNEGIHVPLADSLSPSAKAVYPGAKIVICRRFELTAMSLDFSCKARPHELLPTFSWKKGRRVLRWL